MLRISTLGVKLVPLSNLESLVLSHNNIEMLTRQNFLDLNRLEKLHLDHNEVLFDFINRLRIFGWAKAVRSRNNFIFNFSDCLNRAGNISFASQFEIFISSK